MSVLIVAAILLLGATVVTAAYKSRRPLAETFNQGVSIFDDFLTANSASAGEYIGLYFRSIIDGTGYLGTGSSETYPGYITLVTSPSSDSRPRCTSKTARSRLSRPGLRRTSRAGRAGKRARCTSAL
jgi:hypothetical protein